MTLRIIQGAANAGKTGVVYARMRELLADGQRPVLLLPSKPDADRAAQELSRDFALGVRVSTFAGYIRTAWEQFGDGRTLVGSRQRQLLCASVARAEGGSTGLASLAAQCVDALGEQTGEGWRSSIGVRGGPGERLAAVVHGYATLLGDNGLLEPAEAAHWLVANSMPSEPLLVHRFADFTPSQEAFIRAHARESETWVTVTYSLGCAAATAAAGELIARLGAGATVTAADTVYDMDSTIEQLSGALFGAPASLEAGGSVRFSLAEGLEAEAHRIAEEIRDALLEGTASSEERVAVVFRDPEYHAAALRLAFREADIRADFDVRTPFRHVPFGSAVCHLLAYSLTGERAELLALLRSPFSGAESEAVRELERAWREKGVADGGALIQGAAAVAPALLPILEEVGRRASGELDAEGFAALAGAAKRLLVSGYGRLAGMRGPRDEQDAWAHRALVKMLSEAARLAGAGLTLADVKDALEALTVRPTELERQGHVQVTSVARARGRRFDTLILGGLNAGEFPAAPSESMLPGSAVEEVVRSFGGRGETPLGSEYEQYLFYLVVTRAKRRLVLSARSTDDDGDPVRVSPFFEVAADSFRERDDDEPPPHTYRALLAAPLAEDAAGPRENRRAAALRGEPATPRLKAAQRRSASRTPAIADESLLEGLSARDTFSASEIEAYLECPYGWFHAYAVKPRELERVVGAAEQGTFAHALLQGSYAILGEQGIPRVRPETLAQAMEALDHAYASRDAAAGPAGCVAESAARACARAWAARVLGDDACLYEGFAPAYLEWQFGAGDEVVDAGGFQVTGRVDRVDVDEAGRAIVIDYKRSKPTPAAQILDSGKVQMPLYFLAARARLGIEPIAGIYRRLSKREDRGLVLEGALPGDSFVRTDISSAEEFSAIVDAGVELAREAVAGIRAGRIPCEPCKAASCTYCGAALVCGGAR